ncbi:MAG TPA: hypothetical protein VG028_21220 [Terriglobia bacterium]|nr:hypothetical protein [Terriglobia bacterium]
MIFLLFVVCCWHLIGRWLDRRKAVKERLKPEVITIWSIIRRLTLFGFGVFTLLFSLHEYPSHFAVVIERALLQTWAVFLIGVPFSGLALRLLKRGGQEQPKAPGSRARRSFGNFRLFVVVLGAFAALLILGVVSGPTVPK